MHQHGDGFSRSGRLPADDAQRTTSVARPTTLWVPTCVSMSSGSSLHTLDFAKPGTRRAMVSTPAATSPVNYWCVPHGHAPKLCRRVGWLGIQQRSRSLISVTAIHPSLQIIGGLLFSQLAETGRTKTNLFPSMAKQLHTPMFVRMIHVAEFIQYAALFLVLEHVSKSQHV